MCGRYTINIGRKRFEAVYGSQMPLDFIGSFNLAPTQVAPIITRGTDALEASLMRWGFQRQKHKGQHINARGETVSRLPTFAESFRTRRCIVPASGWYEWREVEGKKQPYYLTSDDGEPLSFAGIWMPGTTAACFSIITTAASTELSHIHDRTPVILGKDRWRVWLSDAPINELEAMLEPPKERSLDFYPVSARVGNRTNNDESLVRSLYEEDNLPSRGA
jgi:putative SOS response-associated peptidase YedK